MATRAALLVCAGLTVFVPPAIAQTVGGFVEFDNITYWRRPDTARINARNQGILQLEVRHAASDLAQVFAAVEIRNDQADPGRNRVFLDEAYVSLFLGDFDVRVGKQIYAWGRADAVNPTDNLSVWDYSDVLDTDDEKIGAVSLRVKYYLGAWNLEGVLVPSFTPSVLPTPTSRWWPTLPDSIANPAFPQARSPTLAATYEAGEPRRPDEGAPSTQYAFRLSGTVRGWDVALSWFDGFDDLPGVETTVSLDPAAGTATVRFVPQYDRRRSIGVDFATTIGDVGFHGEGAYHITADRSGVDPVIDDPYVQYVLGLDYTFGDVLPDKDLFVLIEWVQEIQVPARNTSPATTDLNHVLRQSVIAKADLRLSEFATVGVEGVVNPGPRDWWIRPRWEWSVTDGVVVRVEADLLGGPRDTFFGGFRDNRRLHARLKYSF